MKYINQNGFSLASVLIAVGVSAIVIAGMTTMIGNVQKAQKHLSVKVDFFDLREELNAIFETAAVCSATFGGVAINTAITTPQDITNFSSLTIQGTSVNTYSLGRVMLQDIDMEIISSSGGLYKAWAHLFPKNLDGSLIAPALKPYKVKLDLEVVGGLIANCASGVNGLNSCVVGTRFVINIGNDITLQSCPAGSVQVGASRCWGYGGGCNRNIECEYISCP